jgi:hypothetical protein
MYQNEQERAISRRSFRALILPAKQPAIARPRTVQNAEYFPFGPSYYV